LQKSKNESFLEIREVHQGGPSPNKPSVGGVCRVLATKIVSRLRFSLCWSSWQMQYMEREHAIQVLKTTSCFKYFTCYSGTGSHGSQELFQTIHLVKLDALIWFRYQMIVYVVD